jgi:hypothetical protein
MGGCQCSYLVDGQPGEVQSLVSAEQLQSMQGPQRGVSTLQRRGDGVHELLMSLPTVHPLLLQLLHRLGSLLRHPIDLCAHLVHLL